MTGNQNRACPGEKQFSILLFRLVSIIFFFAFMTVIGLFSELVERVEAKEGRLGIFELAGLYNTTLKEKPTGWYPLASDSDYIVFIADLERKNRNLTVQNMEASAMFKIGDLIRAWMIDECGKIEFNLDRWPERSKKKIQKYFTIKVQNPFGKLNGHIIEN